MYVSWIYLYCKDKYEYTITYLVCKTQTTALNKQHAFETYTNPQLLCIYSMLSLLHGHPCTVKFFFAILQRQYHLNGALVKVIFFFVFFFFQRWDCRENYHMFISVDKSVFPLIKNFLSLST